ncbi:phosphate-selective porin OprO and OprP [Methylomagnum ishizawai]|uniref:Phosphate-selective porin OprO and OprP n=1 Tax=Methylomagnum ishizawai TaxID=1760988 RepID=A0A1Y6CSU7_9GAMM|nr:porin [Methylomagnum ishizawai]SMF93501.1 phosphate-selective porin OprO and OprP [Methylomagnum ishizawai]
MKSKILAKPRASRRPLVATAIAALSVGTAAAADTELLDVLLKNGTITQTQYRALSQKGGNLGGADLLEILQKNGAITKDQYSSLSKKQSAPVAAAPAKAEDKDAAHVKLGEKGLEIESNDGNFKAKIGGRIQVDTQVNFNDNHNGQADHANTDLDNGVGFRRLRLYTEGIMWKDYEYRFEYDWARNGGGVNGITDAYLKYLHFKPFTITIGQMNEGKSMESVMSNNYLTFIERSLPNNAFIESGPNSKYQVGIMAETFEKAFNMPWTVRGGITTESVGAPAPGNSSNNTSAGNTNRNGFSGNTSYQLVGRGTLAPLYSKEDGYVLHTGVWGSWRSVNNNYNADGTYRNGGWQYLSQPDTDIDRTAWINTGNLTKGNKDAPGSFRADEVAMFGAELAGSYGPVHMEAEYMQAQIAGQGYSNQDLLQGFYVQGGWFLTGENRPYDEKKGTWNRVIPHSNFLFGDGWGAWEIAARYDTMDMNTKHINGGSINAGTLGVNWYLTPKVRFMTNWVHIFGTQTGSAGKCTTSATGNDTIGCFNGLSPDIWETAVRLDF